MAKIDDLMRTSGASLRQSASVRPGPAGMASVASVAGLRDHRKEGLDRSKSAWSIPVEKIVALEQPREQFDDDKLDQLAESLQRNGLLNPITVMWSEELDKYRIIAGERRYRAALKANWATVACNVLDKPLAPDELLALQCVENLMRDDLKPIEKAKAFRTLLTVNGWSITRLAENMGISHSAVSQSLRMLELPESIQDKVDDGELSPVAAYHVAKLEDPATQTEVAERIVSEGLNRDQAVEVVRQASDRDRISKGSSGKGRGAKPRKATKLPAERVVKTSTGLKVTVVGRKGFDIASWLEAVEEAAKVIRSKLADDGQDQAAA